jgi:hypothetical protein
MGSFKFLFPEIVEAEFADSNMKLTQLLRN